MPLLRVDLLEGRIGLELQTMPDCAHEAVMEAFEVPVRDRYQIVTEHKPGRMVLQDTGLGFERSERAIVVQVFTSPRTLEMKQAFYKALTDGLGERCGLAPKDVMVSCMTNAQGGLELRLRQRAVHDR